MKPDTEILVVRLQARKGVRNDAPLIFQNAKVVRETKTLIVVEYVPRFDGQGSTRVSKFSKKSGRPPGQSAICYHSWYLASQPTRGRVTLPCLLAGESK